MNKTQKRLYRLAGLVVMVFFGMSLLGMTLGGSPTTPAALVFGAGMLWVGWRLWRRGKADAPGAAPEVAPLPGGAAAETPSPGKPRTCAHCGAVDTPYQDGCCRYCGNFMTEDA